MKRKLTIAVGAAVSLISILVITVIDNINLSNAQSEEDPEIIEPSSIEKKEQAPAMTDYLLPLTHSEKRKAPITHVVIHFTSNVRAKPDDPFQIEDIYTIFDDYYVSAHYVIDRNGESYRFVREERVAYHAGEGMLDDFPEYENSLNDYSIGIELLGIGTKEEMAAFIPEDVYDELDPSYIGFTDAQYEALDELLVDIYEQNPDIERNRDHVIGHDEYAHNRKNDPGELFDWEKIGFE